MKVGTNNNIEMLASKLQQTTAESVQASGRTAQSGVPVTVSKSVRSLGEGSKTTSDVDTAKVQAMREAIANGTFKVNAGAIADKLLTDASMFLGAARA